MLIATNYHFFLEWLRNLLLVVLSIYFNSRAKDIASLPSLASRYCAVDFCSIASCQVNNDKNSGIFNDLFSYSFLFGIDDDDDNDCGGCNDGDDGSSLCYSLDSDGIVNDVDSLCYSVGDDGENSDSLSFFPMLHLLLLFYLVPNALFLGSDTLHALLLWSMFVKRVFLISFLPSFLFWKSSLHRL